MDWQKTVRMEIVGLSAQLAAVDASKPAAIIPPGTRLEQLAAKAAPGPVQNLLTLLLNLMQGIYQQQVKDVPAALAAASRTAAAIEAHLAGGPAETLAPLPAQIASFLGAEAPAAEAVAEATAPAEPAPVPSEPLAVEDAAAMLVGLTPQDTAELQRVAASFATIAADTTLSAAVVGLARETAQRVGAVSAGTSKDPTADLALAGDRIGKLLRQMEDDAERQAAAADASAPAAAALQPASPAPSPAAAVPPSAPAPVAQAPQEAAPPAAAAPAVIAFGLPAETDMDLLREYITECLDHITNAETSLLALETNPAEAEPINTVFRAFHTIKGTSGFLNLEAIQRLAHLSENLLDRARAGKIRITGGYADLCLRSCDTLKSMIESLKGGQPGQPLEAPAHLGELMEHLRDPEAAGFGEDTSVEPMRLGDILVGKGAAERVAIEQAVQDQQGRPLGQVLVTSDAASAVDVAKALRTQQQMAPGAASVAEATIRVGTERLDHLINTVGELVIAQSMVAQDPNVLAGGHTRLARSVAHAGKIVRELQDLTMSLRMVELRATFQKMARLVRDVAKKAGKQVHFVTEGDDTEIDRNMVEALNDPLVHMIRNAVDHGIEPADVRTAKGKNPTGTVKLRAYHAAGSVIIELLDDGKGLDKERILTKAVDKGLVQAGVDLPESEIFALICLPGLSTAEKITDVSGSGVGMDVVKKGIEKLRGRIDIASRSGEGSTFTLRLPLTMAIADAMMVRVGNERYLMPTVSIEHSLRPSPGMVTTVAGKGEMVLLRGQLLPVFRLAGLFGVSGAVTDPYQSLLVVIEGGAKRCALMVDELLAQQQVVIKSLGRSFAQVRGVSGGAILGDGRVGLILDAVGIINLAHGLHNETEISEAA